MCQKKKKRKNRYFSISCLNRKISLYEFVYQVNLKNEKYYDRLTANFITILTIIFAENQ